MDNFKLDTNSLSVAERVIRAFIDAVSEDETYKDISERLEIALLVEKKITEPSLRQALFGDDNI